MDASCPEAVSLPHLTGSVRFIVAMDVMDRPRALRFVLFEPYRKETQLWSRLPLRSIVRMNNPNSPKKTKKKGRPKSPLPESLSLHNF